MFELLIFIICLIGLLIPLSFLLGKFISTHFASTTEKPKTKAQIFFDLIEKPIFKLCGIDSNIEVSPINYFLALFWSNICLCIICFLVLFFQNSLPYKGIVNWQIDIPLILHILSSVITNTCQTHHIPEIHLTHLSNFFIMPLLMFYASASGVSVGVMVIRAIILSKIGNPYVDVIKVTTRILFPVCFFVTLIFSACGMPNTFKTYITHETLENIKQTIILGPIAAFEAIKLIGGNGQSCLNANSSHPFENPNYISNFFEIICILLIPLALVFTIGFWLKNHKQSTIILLALIFVLLAEYIVVAYYELKGMESINNILNENFPNWFGKETRIGIIGSSIFEATKSNCSGACNSSLEMFHPITIAISLFNLSNQSIFGVIGFGLVFTVNFILYTSFFIGLMLGKTPEIFGKRIEKNDIILSSILLLINPFLVLIGVAITLIYLPDKSLNFYEHIHYFTRVFYEFASGAASNGSGLEGLNDNSTYWNLSLALVMFLARYSAMASMILLGGSFARKAVIPSTTTTFKTDTILFGFIFVFMSVISTTLIYFPFVILSPFSEILIPK